MHEMTLQALRKKRPPARRWAIGGMAVVLGAGLGIPGRSVRFRVEGLADLPRRPFLLAMNHTHWLDWIALRWVAFRHGRYQCNWVKPRTYEEGWRIFLDLTGNVPVVSRGYLIGADVRSLCDRVPTEEEYRNLRDHLNTGEPLPEGPLYERIQGQARTVLGLGFDPSTQTWREAMEVLFEQMMHATLGQTRALVDRGLDLAIFPQGATSMQLTQGHSGALQAALSLGLPIVPVGCSGFPQAFGPGTDHFLPKHGGDVIVRFGRPYTPTPIEGHRSFRPASERLHAAAITAGTDALMERINALLEPEHRWAPDRKGTDVKGVKRFV